MNCMQYEPTAFGRPTRRGLLGLCLACVAVTVTPPAVRAADAKTPTVSMVIDYNDGVAVHFSALAHREGMTVLDALTTAAAHKHGITFAQRGSGTTAMLTKIGDLKNEGGGEKSRNWILRVNGKLAQASMAATTLKSGDAVLWKFEPYDYNQTEKP
jgi:Domain of unknown function (DUF4430)